MEEIEREKKRADLRKENNPPAITNRKNDTPTNPPVQATKRTTKHLVLFSHSLSQRGKPVKGGKGGMENGTAKEGRKEGGRYPITNEKTEAGRHGGRNQKQSSTLQIPLFFLARCCGVFDRIKGAEESGLIWCSCE
jgi:hypothetical protein